jgi:hypothetical protein
VNRKGSKGNSVPGPAPIDIHAGDGDTHFNDDYLGWWGTLELYGSEPIADELDDLVPKPKAFMAVEIPATAEYPAAWEAEIKLSQRRGQVIGVEAATHQKSSAMAMLTYTEPWGRVAPARTGPCGWRWWIPASARRGCA